MKRMCKILRVMLDRALWREFIELDMREETRMMHDCGRPKLVCF